MCSSLAMLLRDGDVSAVLRELLQLYLAHLRWFTAVASRVRRRITYKDFQEKTGKGMHVHDAHELIYFCGHIGFGGLMRVVWMI